MNLQKLEKSVSSIMWKFFEFLREINTFLEPNFIGLRMLDVLSTDISKIRRPNTHD